MHKKPDREPTVASLAGRDGPEAGAFCSKPSLATVYHPHSCSGCSSRLECSPLTLRCSEATPLLFWGPLLAPHLLHQDSVPHCPYLSPLAHPETGACVHTYVMEGCDPPPSSRARWGRDLRCLLSAQHRVSARPSVLRKGAWRAGLPSSILITAMENVYEHLIPARHCGQHSLSLNSRNFMR